DAGGGRGVLGGAREYGRARGGAEGGRGVAGVLQAILGELVEVGRRDLPAEGAPLAEAAVVDQDDEHVRRARRGFDDRDLRHLGVLVGPPDDAVERGVRRRQDRGQARAALPP